MSDRSHRLFEIIQILRGASGPVPARVLASRLEVATRTIYRDIVTLQASGVPVEGAAGIGYVMRAGYDLPPLMFSAEEIEAVAIGLSLIGRTGDTDLEDAASRVAQKIVQVLPATPRDPIGSAPYHVSPWNEVPLPSVEYRRLRHAVREQEGLRLTYVNVDGNATVRTVLPLALVYYVESTVLAAWCELRGDFRHFRVDRIVDCEPARATFKGEGERLRADWRSATCLDHLRTFAAALPPHRVGHYNAHRLCGYRPARSAPSGKAVTR